MNTLALYLFFSQLSLQLADAVFYHIRPWPGGTTHHKNEKDRTATFSRKFVCF